MTPRREALLVVPVVALLAFGPTLARDPGTSAAPVRELAAKIDAELDKAAAAEGLAPAPLVDDLTFLRRLTLDVLGTSPSLEEVRALERLPEEGRRERIVERVLADKRAHDQLAERLARVAVGAGVKANTLEDAFFYRRRRLVAWLRDQVAAHRPWDEIVRAFVSAEGVVTDTPPVNFVAAFEGDPVKLAGRTARAFLGVRIDCAQCHDHPFASWKQSDFEGLAAHYGRVKRRGPFVYDRREGELELDDMKGHKKTITPAVPIVKEALPADARTRREALARWLTDPRNPYFAKALVNRAWSWLMGRGLVEPPDELDVQEPEKALRPLLDLLAQDFAAHRFDVERVVRAIVSTRAYARSSAAPVAAAAERARTLHAVAWLKPLHADQLAAAVFQATNAWTYDERRHFLVRLGHLGETNELIKRHGEDLDAERPESPTLLRRLLLLNGQVLEKRLMQEDGPGSVARAADLCPDARTCVETLYLMALTRRPTKPEAEHFEKKLDAVWKDGQARRRAAADLAWALVNSTELSWNR